MKIYSGTGTPIWLSPRHNDNGVIIMQGTSRLMLSADEIEPLIEAMREVMSYA